MIRPASTSVMVTVVCSGTGQPPGAGQGPRLAFQALVGAARAIGIHPRTLTKYVTHGKVRPTLRLPSGQMRWDLEDLKAQLGGFDDRAD